MIMYVANYRYITTWTLSPSPVHSTEAHKVGRQKEENESTSYSFAPISYKYTKTIKRRKESNRQTITTEENDTEGRV